MVTKVIMNLDSSKASGPDRIPVVVPKNCEPELSYIAELFNKFQKGSCFPDCQKVSTEVLRNFRSDIWPYFLFLSNRRLQVVLEFLKDPFLALHFSYYT